MVDFGNRLRFLKNPCRVVAVTLLDDNVLDFGHIRHRLEQNSASDFFGQALGWAQKAAEGHFIEFSFQGTQDSLRAAKGYVFSASKKQVP